MHLKLDATNGCFQPEILPDANLQVTLKNWQMVGKNGDRVDFISAKQFKVPISAVQVSLCDTSPKLTITFGSMGPNETLRATSNGKTATQNTTILIQMLMGIASYHATESGDAKATLESFQDQATKTKALMESHKSDPSWFMSADGQKAIAAMKTLGANMTASTPTGGFNLTTTWTNGTTSVVDETQQLPGGGKLTDQVKIQVQQQTGN